MKKLIFKLIQWYIKREAESKREEDYWRYKDGEVIDTNADHWKNKS
jgi:hypothetical protein